MKRIASTLLLLRRLIFVIAALCATSGAAFAQSSPGLIYGAVPTAAQWNSFFAAKADYPITNPSAVCPTCALTNAANIFTAAQTINLNTATLPAPISGTLLQLGNANGTATKIELDSFAVNDTISMRRADGTAASPTAVQANDTIANYTGLGYDGSAYGTGATIAINAAANNWTTGDHSAVMNFYVTPLGSTTLTNVLTLSGAAPLFTLGTGAIETAEFTSANALNTNALAVINSGSASTSATVAQIYAFLSADSSAYVQMAAQGGGSPTGIVNSAAGLTGGLTISTGAGGITLSPNSGVVGTPGLYESLTGTATTAGGYTFPALNIGSAGIGVYFGSGAPTISAPQGSIYIRTDGGASTAIYYNTTGSTTWVAVT